MAGDAGRTEPTVRVGDYSNHIHITGQARTGTTLMKNLMRCFAGVILASNECGPDVKRYPDRTVVSKQPGGGVDLFEQFPGLNVICMVRDPRDMYCSKKGELGDHRQTLWWPTMERNNPGGFAYSLQGYLRLINHPQTMTIRYEDLVSYPNEMQQKVAERFDLEITIPFSEFHKIAPSEKLEFVNHALNGIRPPDTDSIGRWKNDRWLGMVQEWLRENPSILDFIREMGYEEE